MRRMRWILLAGLLVFAMAASWAWWNKPRKVDMATYAPLDSLIYLEANRPLDVVETITSTDVWKDLAKITAPKENSSRNHWLQRLVGWTGIGPVESVILARAQVAIVVTQLGATEEGDTLRIRPEGAVIIETHTAERRIRAPVEQALKRLAEMTYKEPALRRPTKDGVEFIEWVAPEGGRQLVAAIFGSLVIVGNSEHAVQKCLAVTVQRQPNLKGDPELDSVRMQLGGDRSLTFGYVPAGKSAGLLSIGLPLMLGRPGDPKFERLITASSPKVFGSVGWSSHPYMTGIEDRYLISLRSAILASLKPYFGPGRPSPQFQRVLPVDIHSITYYKFDNPVGAWQNLGTAVSSQIDALSAIVFNSLLKSALLPFGIQDPEKFLGVISGDVLTIRLDQSGERPLLIAVVRDRKSLRKLVIEEMLRNARSVRVGEAEVLEDSQGEIAVGFINEFVVLGAPLDVRRSAQNATANITMVNEDRLRRMTFFLPLSTSATILTYSNDEDRLRSFISAVAALQGARTVRAGAIEEIIASLPYSATETTLGDQGVERVTRSPMGQFSTILPLLVPDQPAFEQNNPQAK